MILVFHLTKDALLLERGCRCRISLWCCREGSEGGSEPSLVDMYYI